MKQVRVTTRVVLSCTTAARVPHGQLVHRPILQDHEHAAVARPVIRQQRQPRRGPRRILEPPKRHLRTLQRPPPTPLDRIQERVGNRLRDQLSSQINVLIIAINAPAPAAATPLRNDSFLATREKKPVSF
jgi:hypothetical protein